MSDVLMGSFCRVLFLLRSHTPIAPPPRVERQRDISANTGHRRQHAAQPHWEGLLEAGARGHRRRCAREPEGEAEETTGGEVREMGGGGRREGVVFLRPCCVRHSGEPGSTALTACRRSLSPVLSNRGIDPPSRFMFSPYNL